MQAVDPSGNPIAVGAENGDESGANARRTNRPKSVKDYQTMNSGSSKDFAKAGFPSKPGNGA